MVVTHRRADGSFVAEVNGFPYHITADDPLFPLASALAAGRSLAPDPVMVAPPSAVMPPPEPAITREKLRTILASLGHSQAAVDAAIAAATGGQP